MGDFICTKQTSKWLNRPRKGRAIYAKRGIYISEDGVFAA